MMAHKHLHQLLTQDQEPFHLHDYIADRRCQLNNKLSPSLNPNHNQNHKPKLHLKKRKPSTNLCNHACFFSFHHSPDVRKSPLFQFQSPAKSPKKVFLHVPARTAAMLHDAAIRIQKQSTKSHKTETKNSGFGLFGSLLKKLKDRSSKSKKNEIFVNPLSDNSSNISRALSKQETALVELDENKSTYEIGLSSCSCNVSRLSSVGWSENNEEKSSDLETSCSSMSEEDLEEVEDENGQFGSCDNCFCASPLSPFRFTLLQSPSAGLPTPDFMSPVTSPGRHYNEDKKHYEAKILEKENVEEEEEKEQCSPVSVLDPLFEDDNEEEQEGEDEDEYDDYDQECSYANVQRTKNQLLAKLRRFERLVDLDPVELDKRMSEQENDDEDEYDNESHLSLNTSDDLIRDVFDNSIFQHQINKIPSHVKSLVFDLVNEENYNGADHSHEVVSKRVCKRLESWKEVESNTIDMMIGKDFEREIVGWKGYNEDQIKESGTEIEVAIFGFLVEELAEELISMVEEDIRGNLH